MDYKLVTNLERSGNLEELYFKYYTYCKEIYNGKKHILSEIKEAINSCFNDKDTSDSIILDFSNLSAYFSLFDKKYKVVLENDEKIEAKKNTTRIKVSILTKTSNKIDEKIDEYENEVVLFFVGSDETTEDVAGNYLSSSIVSTLYYKINNLFNPIKCFNT